MPPRALRVWTWVLVLAPLAWIGGLALRYQITTHTWPEAALDRAGALHKASLEAQQQGVDVSLWRESIELHANPVLDDAMHSQPQAMRRWLYENAPPRSLVAGFENAKTGEKLTFDLNMRGEVTGFHRDLRSAGDCPDTGPSEEQRARQLFRKRFARWPRLNAESPTRSEINVSGRATRIRYSWLVQVPELKNISLRYEADFVCGRVAGEQVSPDPWVHRPPAGFHTERDKNGSIYSVLAAFYFFIAIPWIAVRYIKRSLQREAPQGRILLAGAIFAVFVGLSLFDRATGIRIAGDQVPLPLQIIFGSLGLCVAALLFGMAYAAAEGEVREIHPGAMTSLDALLTGRFFTQNTGVAILLGMALGGWLLLSTQAASLLRQQGPVDLSEVEFAFARVPWLTALLKAPFSAILSGVFGFLVPLAMFQRLALRLFRRWPKQAPRLHLALVFLAAMAGFALSAPSSLAFLGQTLWGVASAAALFAAFFWASDLLAGLAALATLRIGLAAGTLMAAEPNPLDLSILLIAGVGVGVAAWFAATRGEVLSDEDVRPLYASHLAERLRLEKEIDATRVAQRCLLPAAFPRIDGLDAFAACLPARVVAGDFYDAFPLAGGRLAVLLAEGGGQRLARALSIALVKGYLMQKVDSGRSPGEILTALHSATGRLVEGSTGSLCLAIIDPGALALRYARTGEWPELLLRRSADAPALPCAEAAREVHGLQIFEGAATLEPGSLILVYSDGVGRRGSMVRMLRRNRFERNSVRMSAAEIVNTVFGRISRRSRRRLEDDLTLMAVRVAAVETASREAVA
ncbi:MAG: SpoIIE family protein phosphatase [Bryobacteraceae bacterium]|nr:SpoIIE family protein phosphatase [Bryobacteraceae bacterium]